MTDMISPMRPQVLQSGKQFMQGKPAEKPASANTKMPIVQLQQSDRVELSQEAHDQIGLARAVEKAGDYVAAPSRVARYLAEMTEPEPPQVLSPDTIELNTLILEKPIEGDLGLYTLSTGAISGDESSITLTIL